MPDCIRRLRLPWDSAIVPGNVPGQQRSKLLQRIGLEEQVVDQPVGLEHIRLQGQVGSTEDDGQMLPRMRPMPTHQPGQVDATAVGHVLVGQQGPEGTGLKQ